MEWWNEVEYQNWKFHAETEMKKEEREKFVWEYFWRAKSKEKKPKAKKKGEEKQNETLRQQIWKKRNSGKETKLSRGSKWTWTGTSRPDLSLDLLDNGTRRLFYCFSPSGLAFNFRSFSPSSLFPIWSFSPSNLFPIWSCKQFQVFSPSGLAFNFRPGIIRPGIFRPWGREWCLKIFFCH